MKRISTDEVVTLLTNFRNQVLCRNASNQFAAQKLWTDLKPQLSPQEVYDISDDWAHYLTLAGGGVTANSFGDTIKNITRRYKSPELW